MNDMRAKVRCAPHAQYGADESDEAGEHNHSGCGDVERCDPCAAELEAEPFEERDAGVIANPRRPEAESDNDKENEDPETELECCGAHDSSIEDAEAKGLSAESVW